MSSNSLDEWRPFVVWVVAGLLMLSLSLAVCWWSLSTGDLPSSADWYGAGNRHGPWRWAWQGWVFVSFPMWTFLLGAPVAIGDGFRRAWVSARPLFALAGFGVAILYLALFQIHAHWLYWTID